MIFFGAVGAIFLVVALILLNFLLKARRLLEQGNATMATVIKNVVNPGDPFAVSSPGSGGRARLYYAVYEYTVDGTRYEHTSKVGHSKPKYQVGQTVEIHYDPSNPDKISSKTQENVLAILFFVFAMTGITVFLSGLIFAFIL
ncbi:MAG: DUF3592 domain-containing protein [Oscillospiraceae bacterium]|nr:DUF3592 domain-containing protein [Oscillospiraceae bacterium]